MARFQVHQVDPFSDEFADLIACEVASFDNPYQSIFRFLYPIFGEESEEETEAALENLIELHRQWAREDPDSIWLKAVDTENDNRIAGGLLFKVHQANPFASDQAKPKMMDSATWYPPGSRREYINQCLAIFNAPREKFMQRPHLYSFIGFVHPSYRHHGIADLMLEKQCRLADEHGLETYLEAVTAMGVPIFRRHGFIPYRKMSVEPERKTAGEEWRDMERKMQPLGFWPMWRPKGGKFVPGETRLPWDGDLSAVFSKL